MESRDRRGLIFFNASYSLHRLRERRALHLVTHRDLDGYFAHVWSVHPLVGASPDEPPEHAVGPPRAVSLGPRHTFVEGTVGRFGWLRRIPPLNFLAAQASLFHRLHQIGALREAGCIRAADPYFNALWALLLSRLYSLPLEVRLIANYDRLYENSGVLASPGLFRWRWLERRVARCTLSRADLVLPGSDDQEDFALRNGARRESLGTPIGNFGMIDPIHLLPPADRPDPDPPLPIGGHPSVVCVSRLQRDKHPEDVLKALAIVRQEIPSVRGVLVGDGAMRGELEELADRLGLKDHVLLVGDRDQPWLASMLSRATVIVAPLAGLALVEAGLSATPIVAYDVDWHTEVLEDGETGLLVPHRDPGAIAAAVSSLFRDEDRARALGARAREAMLTRMDPRALVEREREQAELAVTLHRRRYETAGPPT